MDDRDGALYTTILDDGTEVTVYPMLFNDRICLGVPRALSYDRAWCVPKGRGVKIAMAWDGQGDPPEWIKEVGTERRGPNTPSATP